MAFFGQKLIFTRVARWFHYRENPAARSPPTPTPSFVSQLWNSTKVSSPFALPGGYILTFIFFFFETIVIAHPLPPPRRNSNIVERKFTRARLVPCPPLVTTARSMQRENFSLPTWFKLNVNKLVRDTGLQLPCHFPFRFTCVYFAPFGRENYALTTRFFNRSPLSIFVDSRRSQRVNSKRRTRKESRVPFWQLDR